MQIFSDISAKGFWMTRWYAQHGREDREKLMAELAAWYEDGSLTPPAHEIVTLGEASQSDSDMAQRAREAISRAQAGFGGKKTFLRFGAGLSAGQSAASQAFLGQRQAQRTFTTWTPQIRKRENVSSAAREISSSSIAQAQVNPGPPPPVEKIGVDAVLRQNPNSPDTHTTTIFSEFSLEGKTAVISGGNGGLGLEMALAYVEAGANVYAIDLPKEPSEEFKIVAEHCKIMDRKLQYISASVTDDADITAAMKHIVKESGRLDICVAAAGILQTYQALDYPVEEFEKVFSVNTTGVFLTARAAAREMHAQPDIHGSIILIASMSGSIVNRDHSWVAYNASKSAVLQMGRNLAAEWGPKDIRVNTISPGHIRTRMTAAYREYYHPFSTLFIFLLFHERPPTDLGDFRFAHPVDQNPHLLKKWSDSNPLGRIGRTHEIRGAAVWLASPASTFCNGSDIVVSGGHQVSRSIPLVDAGLLTARSLTFVLFLALSLLYQIW